MTPEETELRKAVKCLTIEVDASICAAIDEKVSAALLAERNDRERDREEFRRGVDAWQKKIEEAEARAEEAEQKLRTIRTEINCRVDHGAESGGHLEALRKLYWGD